MTSHTDIVVDQFTRQATPFANAAAMRDEEALKLLVEFSGATAADTVLDVACGPGLVVAAFAKVVRHSTGIDLTPAMIEAWQKQAAEARRDSRSSAPPRCSMKRPRRPSGAAMAGGTTAPRCATSPLWRS